MPNSLFILSRDKERAAINRATSSLEKQELLYKMVDAVWQVRETGSVTEAELEPIRAGFLCDDEIVWGRAAGWLAKLVEFAPEITAVVAELSAHRSAAVRYRLCASLNDSRYPDALILPRLKRLLADRDAEVRDMAAQVCLHRRPAKLLPTLEAALGAEQDVSRRRRLKMAIAFIKSEPYWLDSES